LPKLQQVFQLVDDRSHGLHAEDYGVETLRQQKPADLMQFDIDVTSTLGKYAAALREKMSMRR
jgi:hypothetical protein